MSNIISVSGNGKDLIIDKDAVFRQIRCEKDQPLYQEIEEEYEKLLPSALQMIKPEALLGFFLFPEGKKSAIPAGSEVLYMIGTVGSEISDRASEAFQKGDYLEGMLLDGIGSAALYAFEKPVFREIRRICREKHVGIIRRFEASAHIPMELQKTVYDALQAGEKLDMKISEGYMLDPVKSSCQVFLVSKDDSVMYLTHQCGDCERKDCPARRESVTVTVKAPAAYSFSTVTGTNLLEALQENELFIHAPCGGKGRCKKCAVRVLSGNIGISAADRASFSGEELQDGKRLSCQAVLTGSCEIELITDTEENMQALGSITEQTVKDGPRAHSNAYKDDPPVKCPVRSETENRRPAASGKADAGREYGIAIDLGTTTLAFSLVDINGKRVADTCTAVNRQRSYGADVITRIEASLNQKAEILAALIREDLLRGIETLLSRNAVSPSALRLIGIAGNTTMLHLLMGYPTKGLGVFPFTAHTLALEKKSFRNVFPDSTRELFAALSDIPVVLLPGCSVFVGADIVSGLFSLGFHENDEICALIDLGTNGEMAVGNKGRLLVTSAAAGPAFEGGNIEYGTGSIPGAISSVTIRDRKAFVRTIEDGAPCGICGTGVVETAAELLRAGLMDETGALDESFLAEGFPLAQRSAGKIVFTAKDIRELQLAKAAIRAGFEVLLKRYGIGFEALSRLYIAGGFGYYLNTEKASEIGMIPKELLLKTEAVGNSSLNGVIRFMTEENPDHAEASVKRIAESSEEITLSEDPDFGELYIEHMMF
ncbi:MAG: ASKHA domain-containing protein [Lachnospiraceae bacterium]|nr:ASKHA domain-containing protein [Lachnospiraceae bacterium]